MLKFLMAGLVAFSLPAPFYVVGVPLPFGKEVQFALLTPAVALPQF